VTAAAAGAVALGASPAMAYPTWQPYGYNATDCETTKPSYVSTKVVAQTCYIYNTSNSSAQGILLVRNNATVNIKIDAGRIAWYDKNGVFIDSSYCTEMIVVPGELTACYGATMFPDLGSKVKGTYLYNGQWNDTVAQNYLS
jgi:uncharacterized protein YcfL